MLFRSRAYTDAVAQALLQAEKLPLQRQLAFVLQVPYALEGTVRRELQLAGAALGEVAHGEAVRVGFTCPEPGAAGLVGRLNEAGQGALEWVS